MSKPKHKPKPKPGDVEVFTMYITRGGRRIYRKDGRPWHFWAPKK